MQLLSTRLIQGGQNIYLRRINFILLLYALESTTLADIARNKEYNCVAATILYNIICEDFSWSCEAFETPTHVYTIFNNFRENLIVENTSVMGFDILKNIDFPWQIAQMVLQHHERMDGSGYPNGLTDDDILLESKIIGVADVVEAMASHRPYRPALGIDIALEEISDKKDIFYPSDVVEACITLFKNRQFALDI